MAIFFQILYFWWKLGPITMDVEDSSTLFNGRNLETFIGLESCTAFNSRNAVPSTTSISARIWCPRPLWAPSFNHGYRPCALTYNKHRWRKKNSILFFIFFLLILIYSLETFHVWRAPNHSFGSKAMVASPPDLECA
jgi:hypothetical protein